MPFLHVGDVDLYYEVEGQGQPLALIHGLGSSARDWEYQVPFFARDYRVVALDVRGHGRSDKPPGPYSVPLFARDVAGLLEGIGATPAHVCGISMGGMIAFQLAVDRPDLVRSLVVVNSVPDMVVRTLGQRLAVWQRMIIAPLLGMKKMAEVLGGRLFPKLEQGELRAEFVKRWEENDPRAYREALRAIVGWSVSDRLSDIECPALVVSGDEDYTPLEVKAAYVNRMPRAELVVIEDSRHGTPVDQPEAFNEAVAAFLRACEAG
ncbi:MAG: alpha/beta fold hydrolase [Anaerolineae bacterium]